MSWRARVASLHGELAAIAEIDPRWWPFVGGVATVEALVREPAAAAEHVVSDASPTTDTFLGYGSPAPLDPIADAIVRARAAALALRDLDGELPAQPLAVTIAEHATTQPSALDVAAFAVGDACVIARLDDPTLPAQLERALRGEAAAPWRGATPFVCVSVGDEPLATARHGHRRAWTRLGAGPWLGLGRAEGLATVSTCHMIVDGYGHAWIASRIAHHERALAMRTPPRSIELPPLAAIADAIPLGVAWRTLDQPTPRSLPLAYALGRVLHRAAGDRAAPFSPTFQFPIAPGRRDDPMRLRRRAIIATLSVRFDDGAPEPYDQFADRTRALLARESAGTGLAARLIAVARATPAPLAWKRRGISAKRPRWLDRYAEVLGGRACLSMIRLAPEAGPLPPTCAVSSPSRYAGKADSLGSCVVTVVDDRTHAAITACGSGLAGSHASAAALLDELLREIERVV